MVYIHPMMTVIPFKMTKIDNYYWSIIGEHIQIVLGEFSGGNVQSLRN